MIRFNSFLGEHFEDFLIYREKTGYTYDRLRWYLSTLDQYLIKADKRLNQITPEFMLKFREQLKGEPGTANQIFIVLRAFFDYLIRINLIPDNPVQEIPQLPEKSYIPFVFSPEQIEAFLKTIQRNIRKTKSYLFLTDLAVYNAILMMTGCGMRISEPLRLKDEHYCPKEKTIYIEKTKFNKDRLIPVPNTIAESIENFLSVRNAVHKCKIGKKLLCAHKGPVSKNLLYKTFHKAVNDIEISRPKQSIGNITFGHPRPHSLRHSFAVNTLKNACKKGRSPENILPVLAAYMGHSDYRYTMKYLKVIDAEHFGAWVNFCIFKRDREGL